MGGGATGAGGGGVGGAGAGGGRGSTAAVAEAAAAGEVARQLSTSSELAPLGSACKKSSHSSAAAGGASSGRGRAIGHGLYRGGGGPRGPRICLQYLNYLLLSRFSNFTIKLVIAPCRIDAIVVCSYAAPHQYVRSRERKDPSPSVTPRARKTRRRSRPTRQTRKPVVVLPKHPTTTLRASEL